MQHKCAQHKWDHFLRNYETNVLDFGGTTHMMKHIVIKPTKEEKEKLFFFTLSSQC